MIGKTISHYKILEKLGEGGMGVVYKAEDTKLKRTVALKFLPPEMTRYQEAKERFIHEAQAASALDHNNVCAIHEINETEDGQLFIVMACYEGEILKDKIERGPLKLEEAVDIAIQIAKGLEKAHKKEIVHRDIKPANIFITNDGIVKIFDFGLAKLAGPSRLTKTGTTLGTIFYMSPEQAKGENVDFRTDIWSFGVVLYEMLTANLPFKGDYEQAVIYSILNEDPIPITHLCNNISIELAQIVDNCLRKSKDERYQTIIPLLDDLEHLKHGVPKKVNIPLRTWNYLLLKKSRWKILSAISIIVVIVLLFPIGRELIFNLTGSLNFPSEKHIAVLPFTNIGNDLQNQAFCDGLAEIITSKLTQLEQFQGALWVVPFSEIRRQEITSALEAKKQFEVTLAITGSLQKNLDYLLLTLNLVDTKSLRQLKSIVIDNTSSNLTLLQDRIISNLIEILQIELQPEDYQVFAAIPTTASQAYDLYIQGCGYLVNYQNTANVDSAIQSFKQALEYDSDYVLAFAGLGESYLRKYRADKDVRWINYAKEYCNHSLDRDNRLAPVFTTLGLIHTETGKYEEALDAFRIALQINPVNADALEGMATAYEKNGEVEEAERIYQKAIQLRPSYWAGYSKLGSFYFYQGRYEDALTQFHKVIELTPENVSGYTNLGGIYFMLERWTESREMFEYSIKVKPTYRAYTNLGTLDFHEQNFAEAAQMYEKALKLSDTDYRVWGYLAESYYWTEGSLTKAVANYKQAVLLAEKQLEVNPNDQNIFLDLANFYSRLDDETKSLTLLNRSINPESSDPQHMFSIAEIYEQLGKRNLALQWFEKALESGYPIRDIQNQPSLKNILSDDRFQKLLENVTNK